MVGVQPLLEWWDMVHEGGIMVGPDDFEYEEALLKVKQQWQVGIAGQSMGAFNGRYLKVLPSKVFYALYYSFQQFLRNAF